MPTEQGLEIFEFELGRYVAPASTARLALAPHPHGTPGRWSSRRTSGTMYSLRRAGERSARNNQKRHGLPRDEIDLYSGWDLSEHSRDMQLHYAGQDRQHRIKRCDITRWI